MQQYLRWSQLSTRRGLFTILDFYQFHATSPDTDQIRHALASASHVDHEYAKAA